MISLTGRAGARRIIAAGAAVGLTLGAVAIVRSQTAEAATKTTPFTLNCNALNIPQTVTTSITTTTSPDPLHSGDTVSLMIETSTPTGIALDIPVTSVGITIPIPAQVDLTKPSSVTLSGGNLTGSGSVVDGALRINMTGNTTSTTMQIPMMMISSTLKSGIGGQTINWGGPSAMDIQANLAGTPIPVACSPAASNGPVAVTPVAPDVVPTTVAPTTVAPTTVAPTTRPPTTVAPTTRPPTTVAPTTRPPTTHGPTTMKPPHEGDGGGLIALIRRLLCILFHLGC